MIEIVPSNISHAYELSRTLRDQDRQEITCFGRDPKSSIRYAYKTALVNKTALVDGKVAAMWGVGGTILGYTGIPWLLTSNLVEKYPLFFTSLYRKEVKEMLGRFSRLENFVLASYDKSVRLLSISGFNLDEPTPVGPNGVPYRRFWIERKE